MSNNKQSSVDWLIQQMFEQGYFDGNKPLTFTNLDHLQEIAKAMHKEEIINATIYGDRFEGCYGLPSEEYYNETFGGDK